MSAPPKRTSRKEVLLTVTIPGELKNRIVAHLDTLGVSLNHWVGITLERAVREGRGVPEPPQAPHPIPTRIDILREYLTGEQLTLPCGRVGTCSGVEGNTMSYQDASYCHECGIRVT